MTRRMMKSPMPLGAVAPGRERTEPLAAPQGQVQAPIVEEQASRNTDRATRVQVGAAVQLFHRASAAACSSRAQTGHRRGTLKELRGLARETS